jgi:hypothetical protein
MTHTSHTERAETALLALAAERPFATIGFADIVARADLGFVDLRRLYDRPIDILVGFTRRIDIAVLGGLEPASGDDGRRDRLFGALMRRFDLLQPYRAGLSGLARSARTDPVLAAKLASLTVGSQRWMLEAAGISTVGGLAYFRAPALAAGLARVVPVFLDEDDSGLPKTMKALDETLDRLGKLEDRVEAAKAKVEGVFRRCRDWKPRAEKTDEAWDPSI